MRYFVALLIVMAGCTGPAQSPIQNEPELPEQPDPKDVVPVPKLVESAYYTLRLNATPEGSVVGLKMDQPLAQKILVGLQFEESEIAAFFAVRSEGTVIPGGPRIMDEAQTRTEFISEITMSGEGAFVVGIVGTGSGTLVIAPYYESARDQQGNLTNYLDALGVGKELPAAAVMRDSGADYRYFSGTYSGANVNRTYTPMDYEETVDTQGRRLFAFDADVSEITGTIFYGIDLQGYAIFGNSHKGQQMNRTWEYDALRPGTIAGDVGGEVEYISKDRLSGSGILKAELKIIAHTAGDYTFEYERWHASIPPEFFKIPKYHKYSGHNQLPGPPVE